LEGRLKEERTQKDQYKDMKNGIEDERKMLDRTVEKLQKEVRGLESRVENISSQQATHWVEAPFWSNAFIICHV